MNANEIRNNNLAITGWDIGGANLKAARLDVENNLKVVQHPFPIWQGRDELAALLANMSDQLGPASQAAITITAELSDAFRSKREGIRFVVKTAQAALKPAEVTVFGIDGRFHSPATACQQPLLVAAANWMATARLVASHVSDCLLVDIGSTTVDIIPIAAGKVLAQGRNDPERLLRGELLYTGALRTPVFAVVRQVPLWGGWCPVAAELFATVQDVHLLLGSLTPERCQSPTADGRPATREFALERLARVVCADTEMLSIDEIFSIARHIASEQVDQITRIMAPVLSGTQSRGPVIAVGVGAFLAKTAADRLGLEHLVPAGFDPVYGARPLPHCPLQPLSPYF